VLASDVHSLTETARLMGESKATVSRRIARLESSLGVPLLRRSPRGVEPTDDGTAYRVRVAEILELLGDANGAARRARDAPSGHLRVTAPPGFEAELAPKLAEFARVYPDVLVTVLVTDRFVDLDAEHVDVALRATAKLADSALVAHRLLGIDRVAVASPAYLREHVAPKRVDQLPAHRIVQLGEARTTTLLMRKHDAPAGEAVEVRLSAAIGATDVGLAKELALAGAGIAVLPRLVVQRLIDEGSLVHVLRSYVVTGASLFLLHRGGRFLPPKIRAFRELLLRAWATPARR
jgi:DNA-binding transcriptional LysR family regulator